VSSGFAGILWGFRDDERRVLIDAHPKLVAHVADRVASDLAQVSAISRPVCVPHHASPLFAQRVSRMQSVFELQYPASSLSVCVVCSVCMQSAGFLT
jgi:hypothetical protein